MERVGHAIWMPGFLAICVALVALAPDRARAQETAIPDTVAQRVQACAPCHGAIGEGTSNAYFPRLAGKPAGYLYNQLQAFRDGRRKYPPMNYLLAYLPDAYLHQIADYFAAQHPPLPAPTDPEVSPEILAHGETLATQGDYARGIPACQSCHGTALTGMEPGIPGLIGLRPSYISAQLGGWRYGTRTAAEPDCMQIVAGHLTEDDVKAVAAWLASRIAPADPGPRRERQLWPALRLRQRTAVRVKTMARSSFLVGIVVGVLTLSAAARAQDAGLIAKGEYLARAGDCLACHTAPEGKLFAGGRAMPTPFGTLYTSNITPDPETGIGKWNADDFYKTMHSGRFPDGALIYPAMPFASYTKVTRTDSDAIFAYLKSIPPVKQTNREHALSFPYDNRSLILGWRTLFFTEGEYTPDASKSDEWNRGAYIVEGLGHCAMCHTAINALGGSSDPRPLRAASSRCRTGTPRR